VGRSLRRHRAGKSRHGRHGDEENEHEQDRMRQTLHEITSFIWWSASAATPLRPVLTAARAVTGEGIREASGARGVPEGGVAGFPGCGVAAWAGLGDLATARPRNRDNRNC